MAPRIIIAGGGTGGHIFPAVAIAGALRQRFPDAAILFAGASGGMEMSVVPRNGYEIKAVWISGIQRQLSLQNILRNLLFPLKFIVSQWQAWQMLRKFQPQVVVGVGGYASGPVGRVALRMGIPLILCEQNAYPGLVNRWLAPKASAILLGNAAAARYFDPARTVVTGNPIRQFLPLDKPQACAAFGLDPAKPVILSVGGSLGARSLNQALHKDLEKIAEAGVQLIWQTGKIYYESLAATVEPRPGLVMKPFIEDMAAAYGAADLVISRAGGSTISEMVALNKVSVLVPSPNVAEDHQTKNALSLSEQGAALLVRDAEAAEKLVPEALALLKDAPRLAALQASIAAVEKHDAASEIVEQLMKYRQHPDPSRTQ